MPLPNTPNFFSPGIKIQEVDLSGYSTGQSGTVVGLIGIFQQGPIATPTLVTSLPQAQQIFGTYLPGYYGMYAVKQFFDNGGQQLYIVRTAHYTTIATPSTLTAVAASLTLIDSLSVSPNNTVTVTAVNQGTWGNGATGGISVAVGAATINPTTEWKLTVYYNGVAVETWDNLSMTSTSSDYFENVVNGNSSYVTLTDLSDTATPPNNIPKVITQTSLSGGNDGLSGLADADFVGDPNGKTGLYAFNTVVPLNIVVAPGQADYTMANGLITYCSGRADCFALLEVPLGSSQTNALAYRAQTTPYTGTIFDSNYAALTWPWLNQIDPVTGLVRPFPPSAAWAGMMARTDATNGPWYPAAGINNGVLAQVVSLEQNVDQTTNDAVYPSGINIPYNVPGIGFVMFGQKTLQRRVTELNRINVRRTVLYIEQFARSIGMGVLFQPNTNITQNALKRDLTTFLKGVQSAQGLYNPSDPTGPAFKVVCDSTNNTALTIAENQLNCLIAIIPATAVEFLTFTVMIGNGTVSLDELFSSN